MARHRKNLRNVHGILVLDKPVGISSNAALQDVKRLFRARKAGHTGSLDPIASGLLLICFGEATKLSAFLLEADKRYLAECTLGIRTTTGDVEGEVMQRREPGNIPESRIRDVLCRFTGVIEQVPPMYSALKHKGKRLYELAREGLEVERTPREVRIRLLDLVSFDGERLTLDIECSKGTYIRTLAEDIGEALGCGAHVTRLRRTGLGPYAESDMVGMDRLRELANEGTTALDESLQPLDSALSTHPGLVLNNDLAYYARTGQPVLVPGAPVDDLVRLYDEHNVFLGIGRILDDGRVAPKRLVFID
ncbi:MAG: tRNA pseudouridine(55) synthase TruB [Gammaproteobacteria bacterium]|jgi:tRNA pseudouridine55 synthase|nr:tRNA pseudouridine(55) synthase TruB [Gammaproteobacteria bacterium]